MKKEVLLLDAKDYNAGCAVYFFIGISVIFSNIIFILKLNANHSLNLFIILMVLIFGWVINENRVYKTQNRKSILFVSEQGIFEFRKSNLIDWAEISEIQIIDRVLSVTVDNFPKKDFKVNLSKTDLNKKMKYEEFEDLLRNYYKKDIYTYTSPPSCGCC